MNDPSALSLLQTFRTQLLACFTRRRDALFELVDALLTGSPVPAPVHLSLAAVHRRGWGSLYAALRHGRLDLPALQHLIAAHPLGNGQPIYAVDVSVWPRCDAETSPDRGYYYHPSRHSAGQPIVAGWAYQWIAQLSFTRDSWTAPMDVRRVHPTENANTVAGDQIATLLGHAASTPTTPLFVFDAGYDPVQVTRRLEGLDAAVLVRLRSDRCFYADPMPPTPTSIGRPRRHGAKFVCGDPTTWPDPTATLMEDDSQYGQVRVRAWAGLHAKPQGHGSRGTRGPRPLVRGWVVLVEVTRLPGHTRKPKVLWLWWAGPGTPDLAVLWRAYVRRFDLEHTFRFVKQTLGWTTPRVRHPEQADRWTWLVVASYTLLRVARAAVADQRLPWERRLRAGTLTPYRVRRALLALLVAVGTPATAPKPSGRSPGRPRGCRSGPAPRYPTLKKSA
jgi:hypothetical protein